MMALMAGLLDFKATVASGADDACAPARPSTKAAPNPLPSPIRRPRSPCRASPPSFNCLVMSPTSLLFNRLFASLMIRPSFSNERPTSLTILGLTQYHRLHVPQ